jgi:hypothetical protein
MSRKKEKCQSGFYRVNLFLLKINSQRKLTVYGTYLLALLPAAVCSRSTSCAHQRKKRSTVSVRPIARQNTLIGTYLHRSA